MKKILSLFFTMAAVLSISACGTAENQDNFSSVPTENRSATSVTSTSEKSQPTESSDLSSAAQISSATENSEEQASKSRQISVQFGENTAVYELNNSAAANSLYEQLPLTVEAEDFSNNEKIFYPPQELDTEDSPLAQSGAGTLAYYEPWGDVVFFYGDYNESPSLYELGQVVSGGELVSKMSGTITIEAVE